MKEGGKIIMIIGLLITLFTGFKYFTKEKVVDLGSVEITANKKHSVNWSPMVGVGVILLGGLVFMMGSKKI
ncbi:MAG: hypothetical protein ABI761_09570 [Saprospiraceae bacterium]